MKHADLVININYSTIIGLQGNIALRALNAGTHQLRCTGYPVFVSGPVLR